MKMTKEVLKKIEKIACSKNVEIGGILGSKDDDVISCVVADMPDYSTMCRFDYYPNIAFLNKQIESWADDGIAFGGLFHTHFSGSKNLSDADIEYIKEIMLSSKGIVEYLYFPLFTLPDNELTVYKAYFNNANIVVDKDELIIV